MQKSLRKNSGFTLVELLVVVAVIGLLAALLFPALARVREGARTKVCLSNMKQLGLAFDQYVQDNGRRYPGAGEFQKWGGLGQAAGTKLPDGSSGGHWVKGLNDDLTDPGMGKLARLDNFTATGKTADVEGGAIYPYVRSAQVYVCPSNADGRAKKLSYSMNCAIAGMHDVRMSQPSEIVLLVDEETNNDGYWYAANATGSTDRLTQRHNNGGNLLFADGHVKYYGFDTYVLDNSTQGLANKVRMTGTPRFYDRSFGPLGYYTGSQSTLGSCLLP